MVKNLVSNSAAGATCIYCGVGGFGPPLARIFGRFQFAADLEWVMILFIHPDIQWGAMFRLFFLIALFLLIGINWRLLASWIRRIQERMKTNWNSVARDAVYYIAFRSSFGYGKPDKERFMTAVDAFNNAMHAGKLKVFGRRPGDTTGRELKIKELEDIQLKAESVSSENEGTGGQLVDKKGKIVFEGLMVDKNKVQTLWHERQGGEQAWLEG